MYRNSPIIAWRNNEQRYELVGSKCDQCNMHYYAKSYYCSCGSFSFSSVTFSGQGILVSFTEVIIPPVEFVKAIPYIIGLIKLQEGPQLISQIIEVDFSELKIGMSLVSVFRRYFSGGEQGMIHYGLKFTAEKNI